MQAPIVKDNILQYIIDDIYKELNSLSQQVKRINSGTNFVKGFTVVKTGNNDFRIEVESSEGIVVSPSFTLKEK